MRLLYWTAMFLLMTLVTHVAYVLFAPRLGARALVREMRVELDEGRLHMLSPQTLKRIVRHPVDTTIYAACMLSLEERDAILRGASLRGLWMLTVYSERGDVIYTISDRHVPPGPLHIRFELKQVDEQKGEIALPKLEERRMVVPLDARHALLLLEAWPWHPGQYEVLRAQVAALKCEPAPEPRQLRPEQSTETDAASAGTPSVVLPRPRPEKH